jgi:hypothetical protein
MEIEREEDRSSPMLSNVSYNSYPLSPIFKKYIFQKILGGKQLIWMDMSMVTKKIVRYFLNL